MEKGRFEVIVAFPVRDYFTMIFVSSPLPGGGGGYSPIWAIRGRAAG